MKNYLLIMFIMILTSNAFGQNLVENWDFEMPDDGKEYNSIDSIPGWLTDDSDPATGKTKRKFDGGNGVASLNDNGASMYQVIGTVPDEETTYSFSLSNRCYYAWFKDISQDISVNLSAFSGSDPSVRVAIDSALFSYSIPKPGPDWPWETNTGEFIIPAGSEFAGDSLVFEINVCDSGNINIFYFDSINIEKNIVFNDEFMNGDFEMPDDGKEYNSIDSIPGWLTDDSDPATGKTKRKFDGDNGVASLNDNGASMYQVIGTVPDEETTYSFSLSNRCYYAWFKDISQDISVNLSAFSGNDPSARVAIDSALFSYSIPKPGPDWPWETNTGELTIPAGSGFAGEYLVFEINVCDSGNINIFYFDSVSIEVKPDYPSFSGVFENGDFELPEDNISYQRIDSIPGWLTDDMEAGNTGRRVYEDGSRVGFQWDGTSGIYQVIGEVPSAETQYSVSFDVTCFYSFWSDYITNMYVIFSSFSGPDPSIRVPMDSLKFQVSCKSADWKNWVAKSGTYTIPGGSPKAGEHLVMELEIQDSRVFGFGEAQAYLHYDNVVLDIVSDIENTVIDDNITIIPSYGKIEIKSPEKITKISVYDLLGRKIKSSDVNAFNPEIMIGDLKGIYLVKVDMYDHFVIKKVYFNK